MSKALTIDEIKNRCELVKLTYVSHYVEKQATFVIGKCQCGEPVKTKLSNITKYVRENKTYSCKECGHKKTGKSKLVDLTGMKFGRLTVIERAEDKKYKEVHWVCQCECGVIKHIHGESLKHGHSISCGCFKSESSSERMGEMVKQKWQDEDYKQTQIERAKKRTRNKNPNYRGGITIISKHLRNVPILTQWKKDTYIRENSRCQLTGKKVHGGNSDVHHLKGFNTIVREAHELHNIEIKEQVKDYTEEELKLLEDYVAEHHKDNSNAVLLSSEVHDLFHHVYGSKDNTPEQYEEFKIRYLNGEFDKELNPINNKVA